LYFLSAAEVTQNKQVPWNNSSLLGEIYLASAKL
jgi:hypothetical protein